MTVKSPAAEEADGSPPDADPAGSTVTDAPGAGETAAAPAPADGGPQPTAAGEAAVLLRREVASAAVRVAEVLDGGDIATARAAMDAICAAAAQSRRLLKAAASGRKPRGTTSTAALYRSKTRRVLSDVRVRGAAYAGL